MNPRLRKGLIVALLHVTLVASLGAKLLVDRSTRPRVWARSAPFDPNLPIRGRYVRLRLEALVAEGAVLPKAETLDGPEGRSFRREVDVWVLLSVQNGALVATPVPPETPGAQRAREALREGARAVILQVPLAYFIPEHVVDPSIRTADEELWVEVTLPRRGPPRPIQLGVKKDGTLTPLP